MSSSTSSNAGCQLLELPSAKVRWLRLPALAPRATMRCPPPRGLHALATVGCQDSTHRVLLLPEAKLRASHRKITLHQGACNGALRCLQAECGHGPGHVEHQKRYSWCGDRPASPSSWALTTGGVVMQSSLYERLGGVDALRAVTEEFEARAGKDLRNSQKFARTDLGRLTTEFVDQLCEASGGTCSYTGSQHEGGPRQHGCDERRVRCLHGGPW